MNYQSVIHGKYDPHIDGIRTLAILPVVLYHLYAPLCPGGFIGVDIFFVISGYLITKGILKSLDKGTFSLIDFYNRRIRRIIPAYLFVSLFIALATILTVDPKTSIETFKGLGYSSVFATNFFFRLQGGYFASNVEENPTLHLWSLSVEEQFYIFIPLILFLIFKAKKSGIKPALYLFFFLSLALSLYCNYAGKNITNFYMLPTRAWELLAGSILAAITFKVNKVTFTAKLWSILGLILVALPCIFYSKDTLFPGITATVPVLGAFLLLKYGQTSLCGSFLSSKPMVSIGKISYSLYLWHWPLIVFWNYQTDNSTNTWGLLLIFCTSFLMAYLSWRFIEMPIRLSKKWTFKKGLIFTTASLFGLVLFSYHESHTHFLSKKIHDITPPEDYYIPPYSKNFLLNLEPNENSLRVLGKDENPQYILWGDSHSQVLTKGFEEFSLRNNINGLWIRDRIPLLYHGLQKNSIPPQWFKDSLEWITKQTDISTVILINRWALYCEKINNEYPFDVAEIEWETSDLKISNQERWHNSLISLCSELKSAGKNVIIISSIPEQGKDIYEALSKEKIWNLNNTLGIDYTTFMKRQKNVHHTLHSIEKMKLATIIWSDKFFFPDKTYSDIKNNERSYYIDDDHLSPTGSSAFLKSFEQEIIEVL